MASSSSRYKDREKSGTIISDGSLGFYVPDSSHNANYLLDPTIKPKRTEWEGPDLGAMISQMQAQQGGIDYIPGGMSFHVTKPTSGPQPSFINALLDPSFWQQDIPNAAGNLAQGVGRKYLNVMDSLMPQSMRPQAPTPMSSTMSPAMQQRMAVLKALFTQGQAPDEEDPSIQALFGVNPAQARQPMSQQAPAHGAPGLGQLFKLSHMHPNPAIRRAAAMELQRRLQGMSQ